MSRNADSREGRPNTARRILLISGLLTAIAAAFAGAALIDRRSAPPPSAIGGAFQMVDQNGAPADEARLRGRWSAVFFGYTFCPDVCPTTLAALGQASRQLGERARDFQAVFVSIDPERDTPAVLKTYLSSASFPTGTVGLTGTPEQVAAIAKAYKVYYRKTPQGASYSMDHSAVVYLMDPKGRFSRPLDVSASPTELARQIREAMAGR